MKNGGRNNAKHWRGAEVSGAPVGHSPEAKANRQPAEQGAEQAARGSEVQRQL